MYCFRAHNELVADLQKPAENRTTSVAISLKPTIAELALDIPRLLSLAVHSKSENTDSASES